MKMLLDDPETQAVLKAEKELKNKNQLIAVNNSSSDDSSSDDSSSDDSSSDDSSSVKLTFTKNKKKYNENELDI
jgi:hypothetical protein